jgi:hypothetical protein
LTTKENSAPNLREIDLKNEHADGMARLLQNVSKTFSEELGPDFAGFALVAWDMQGGARTIYTARRGMVARSLVPAFVADNLSRHIAVDLAQEENLSHEVTPEDPA